MLNHNQARSIAESIWGKGGTQSIPTNTNGAFYFSCSSHGGFVIDARVLSPKQRALLSEHVSADTAITYKWAGKTKLNHTYRTTGFKTDFRSVQDSFNFFVLEEDCAWSLAYVLTDIRLKNASEHAMQYAQQAFKQWYSKEKS